VGWSSGSALFAEVWDIVKTHIPENKRIKVCEYLIDEFEKYDCDTIGECEDKYIQEALRSLHPDWYEEDE
jgi:hypothetical protein